MTCTHSKNEYGACPVCQFEPFVRNHYFDGKFMVARDFTDETTYHSEKRRHHNVRLHGRGVVCGLQVGAHPSDPCQDRFLTLTPGAAIDCCGHDILVADEDTIEIKSRLKKLYEKDRENLKLHTLQVCVTFRECGTEEVPVLYDECGCDETRCDHNRILESYDIDVVTDPPLYPEPHHSAADDWGYVFKSGGAWRISHRVAGQSCYVVNAANPNQLLELDPEQRKVVAIHTLPANVKALAVAESNGGSRIYVAAESVSGNQADPRRLLVLEKGSLETIKTEASLPNSGGSDVALAVLPAPDNRLLALVGGKDLLIWDTTLDSASPQPNPTSVALGTSLRNLAVAIDGKHAYSLDATNRKMIVIDIAAPTASPTADTPIPLPPLSHEPFALAVDPTGSWAFVLEQEGEEAFVEMVNLVQAKANRQPSVVMARRIARSGLVVMAMGKQGTSAVVDMEEGSCESLLWTSQITCPSCERPNCVVLATIERYQLDAKLRNAEPNADATADIQGKIARIDNRKGRRILARTEVLQEMIECLLRRPAGGAGIVGPQGPPGQKGEPGDGIDAVDASIIPCNQAPAAPTIQTIGEQRTLKLEIPRGCDGKDAVPQDLDLTHICAISWTHGEQNSVGSIREGVRIAFDKKGVNKNDLTNASVKVLVSHKQQIGEESVTCWCEIPIEIAPKLLETSCDLSSKLSDPELSIPFVNALQITFSKPILVPQEGTIRIIVNGDFIRDANGKGLDADHLPPWFQTDDYRSGDGIAGGTFESWLRTGRRR